MNGEQIVDSLTHTIGEAGTGHDTAFLSIDASQMDASRDTTLRSIENEVIKYLFDSIFFELVNRGDYP